MGSPLGPLVANAFLCSIEEQLERENKLPSFYRRYVDDTLSSVPDIQSATTFLATLNKCHPSIHFTMEIADSNKLPFLGMMIEKKDCELVTSVYRKPTNNGLLLHFQSHVDMRYKKSLIRTMLHRAYRLSSSWESIVRECDHLKGMFFKLGYPDRLVDATITSFLHSVLMDKDQVKKNNAMSERNIVRVVLPFKDHRSADFVRKQLKDLGNNIGKRYSRVQKLASNFKFRRGNHPSLAGKVLFINLNVICAIQIISATLLVISISELKNIEPPPVVHM